jgi:DEAD/DEAH box helicase domain-containing protein
MVIAQALAGAPDARMGLKGFLDFLPRYWSDSAVNPRALEPERYVAELIAPNMLWYEDYRHLREKGAQRAGSKLVEDVSKRLQWEVLAEFGYRSRVGRSLERTGTAVLGVETEPVAEAARALLPKLREDLGLRDLEFWEVAQLVWGIVLRMKARGAIHHPFLDPFIAEGRSKFLLGRPHFMPLDLQVSELGYSEVR